MPVSRKKSLWKSVSGRGGRGLPPAGVRSLRFALLLIVVVVVPVTMTVMLTLVALSFSVLIGLPAGICAAKMRGSWFDMASMLIAITGVSMPTFWVGLNLIFIFAVSLGWLPVAGYLQLSRVLWGNLRYQLIPAFTLPTTAWRWRTRWRLVRPR